MFSSLFIWTRVGRETLNAVSSSSSSTFLWLVVQQTTRYVCDEQFDDVDGVGRHQIVVIRLFRRPGAISMNESNSKILRMEGLSNLKVLKISIRCGQEIRQSNNLVPSFHNLNLMFSRKMKPKFHSTEVEVPFCRFFQP